MPDLEGFRHDVRVAANRNAIDSLLDLSDDEIGGLVTGFIRTLTEVRDRQAANVDRFRRLHVDDTPDVHLVDPTGERFTLKGTWTTDGSNSRG